MFIFSEIVETKQLQQTSFQILSKLFCFIILVYRGSQKPRRNINSLLKIISFYGVQEDHSLICFCQNLHVPIFEEVFVTLHQDIYDLMCGLHSQDTNNDRSTDETKFCGGRPYTQILKSILPFLFVSLLTSYKLGPIHCQTILSGVVVNIKRI